MGSFKHFDVSFARSLGIERVDKALAFWELSTASEVNTKVIILGSPVMTQRLTNPMSIHENTGSIPDLAQWAKDPLAALL